MITCPRCQTPVEDGSRFCDHCGKPLVSENRIGVVSDIVELIVVAVTILGLADSVYCVFVFLTTPPSFGFSSASMTNASLVLDGIPFSTIVYGLVGMAVGGAYYSIRSFWSVLRRRYAQIKRMIVQRHDLSESLKTP